jgi:VIT1/CCC1 family predicted Fe2+/Mn2+ transporter
VVSVLVALALTGWASARFGYGPSGRAMVRNVLGGLFAMAVTYAIGSAIGTQV